MHLPTAHHSLAAQHSKMSGIHLMEMGKSESCSSVPLPSIRRYDGFMRPRVGQSSLPADAYCFHTTIK